MDFDIQKNKGIIVSIIIVLILSGITVTWIINKDNSTIKRDGKVLARMRWHVEAERTWSQIKYSYQRDSCIKKGGTVTASDRCYYPADYYEILKRSLIRTKIEKNNSDVIRITPYYKYGTRGAYAGKLEEKIKFKNINSFEDFQKSYVTKWDPKDTRNYKIVFRVWDLKEQPLSDGNYTLCQYEAKNIKIDLKDECQELDHAEVKGDRIWFYFNKGKGIQTKDIYIIDPINNNKNNSITEILKCINVIKKKKENTYSTCIGSYSIDVCEIKGYICDNITIYYNYTCINGTKEVNYLKEFCTVIGYNLGMYKLQNFDNYYCSNNDTELICDSIYDGNGDGKCQKGESCVKFVITKENVQRQFRNSRDDFVEDDKTFRQQKLQMEVI